MEILFEHERIEDFLVVEEMLINNRLLIDPIDTESDHPCRLVNYFLAPGVNFKCLLDRNVVSYLIELVNGKRVTSAKKDKCYRLTAALQAFLNASEVYSEPGMAYHEYMETSGIEKADKELSFFRSADNLNPNIYLDIATGIRDSVPPSEVPRFDTGEILYADIPRKLRHFETNIVFIKKALSLKSYGYSDYRVLLELIDWIYKYYIFSAPSFHFLSIYFSSKKISNMIKSHTLKGIRNATWDLCLIQQLITNIRNDSNNNIHWLLSTFDKAIQMTTDLVFIKQDESVDEYYSRLEKSYSEMWGKRNNYGSNLLDKLIKFQQSAEHSERNIVRFNGSNKYILSLRKEVEQEFQKRVNA